MNRTLQPHNNVFYLSRLNLKIIHEVSDTIVTDTAEIDTAFNNHFSSFEQGMDANFPSLPDVQKQT